MQYFPPALERLTEQFARLPGIGHKSAQRLAFFVLSQPEEDARAFADAIVAAGEVEVNEALLTSSGPESMAGATMCSTGSSPP